MCGLSVASKSDTDWVFLTGLRDQGWEMTEQWLQENFDNLGVCDSVDLDNEFVTIQPISPVTALSVSMKAGFMPWKSKRNASLAVMPCLRQVDR